MNNTFKNGTLLGRKHYAEIISKSDRWKSRHIPVQIREHLLKPFYISEDSEGRLTLFIIQLPILNREKVHFIPYGNIEIENSNILIE